jgi:hypothetical protein
MSINYSEEPRRNKRPPIGQPTEGREWHRFYGRIRDRAGQEVTLEPDAAQGAYLVVNANDVMEVGDEVVGRQLLIRSGSRYLRLLIIAIDAYRAKPIGGPTPLCPDATCCIGNIRYCCKTQVLIGSCDGVARCPDPN